MIHTLKSFQQKIETEFWQFVIPRMKNQPELVGRIMQIGLFFQKRLMKTSKVFQGLFWICLGLMIGLGIGFIFSWVFAAF